MELPHSLRLGPQGKKLNKRAKRTGLKCPDIVRCAIEVLFERYKSDDELLAAIIKFRSEELADK